MTDTSPADRVRVAVLASGSDGNCMIFFYADRALILDAGLSPKIVGERCRAVGMPLGLCEDDTPRKVDAVLLTHWHSDHAKYATRLCVDWACPLITSKATMDHLEPQPPKTRRAKPGEQSELPEDSPFEVLPIAVDHDAEGARAFVIQAGSKTIVVAHDLGHPNQALLAACHAADGVLIEANHDPEMLKNCEHEAYNAELKARILSDKGHLSNQQAAEVIEACGSERLQWVCALHVSKEANDTNLVERTLRGSLKNGARLYIASQDIPLLLEVNGSPETSITVIDDHAQAVKVNREVDQIIAQQVSSDAESQRRKTRLGKLFADMEQLFSDNEPSTLAMHDEQGELIPNFTTWLEDKARALGISRRTAFFYYDVGKFLLPVAGEEAVENMSLGAGDSLALYFKSKPDVAPETVQELIRFAQEHPHHEVRREVFKRLYHGRGHFGGGEAFLQFESTKDRVAQINRLLGELKSLPNPPATDDAELIEFALEEFLQTQENKPENLRVSSLVPAEPPMIGEILEG